MAALSVAFCADQMDRPKRSRPTALLYAEERLRVWADWSKQHRSSLGYPTISMLYKAMRQKAKPIESKKKQEELLKREGPRYTAQGAETITYMEPKVGEPPESVAEVEAVVTRLPADLHTVIIADYFTYGPIEVRAKQTKWKRARYSQLLESAKYAVWSALDSRTISDDPR